MRSFIIISCLILMTILAFSSFDSAAQVKLAWNPSTEPDVAGYRVYYGTASRTYRTPIDVGNVSAYTLNGLTQGVMYYIAVTAYDTTDHESTYSNEVSGKITETETITTPNVLSGPTSGITGKTYTYITGGSVSSLGHSVQYQFDWKGDGTDLSPWGLATQSKIWTASGLYNVRARARCASDTSLISQWLGSVSVSITPATQPDLTETVLNNPPLSAVAGSSFSVTDTVKNQGKASSTVNSFTSYYLSQDTTKEVGDIPLTGSRQVPPLRINRTNRGTVTVTIPSGTAPGSYYLLACADDTNVIAESNETNNCVASSSKVTVNSASAVLSVTPSDGLSSSGNQGGPFSPSSKSYTLQNTGGTSINWAASKLQAWASLSSTSGTLGPGLSATVTVSINSNANSLAPGSYSDTVSFTNTTNGNGDTTRPVSFTVSAQAHEGTARVEIDHTYRGDLVVTVGVGNVNTPSWSTVVSNRSGGSADNVYADVDISGGSAYLPPSSTNVWFLKVSDQKTGDTGTIRTFRITYQGETYSSMETPVAVNDNQTNYAYIPLVIEAEDASIKTGGGAISGGWNLYTNGTVGESVRIQAAGIYEVVVRAYGDPLEGIWPLMALSVDGLNGQPVTVDSAGFKDYLFQVELLPGVHSIGVAFLNDAYNPGVEDRNLYLDKFAIYSRIANPLIIEAEDASIKTTGSAISGGWNLYTNGTVGESVRIQAAGIYEVVVRAYGDPLEGIWPLMALSVDGLTGQPVTVDSAGFMDYSFQVELLPGVHSIGVAFLNDAYNPGVEDRNLYLDNFAIYSQPGIAKAELASN